MARMTEERLAEIRAMVKGNHLNVAKELLAEIDALREENKQMVDGLHDIQCLAKIECECSEVATKALKGIANA